MIVVGLNFNINSINSLSFECELIQILQFGKIASELKVYNWPNLSYASTGA